MRIWRACIVGAAALSLLGAACTSGDDDELEAFDLTGRVTAVEPAAQPAEPTDTDVTGAIVLQADPPEGCQADAGGVRVYVEQNTAFTPAAASSDLDALEGETVSVSGSGTQDGDDCTLFADSVVAQDATGSPDDADGAGTGAGDTGDGSSPASPAGTSAPGATASPGTIGDPGSITDAEETASPRPDEPDN